MREKPLYSTLISITSKFVPNFLFIFFPHFASKARKNQVVKKEIYYQESFDDFLLTIFAYESQMMVRKCK